MRLLVIEDEAELAKAVARGLESLGYAVDIALDAIDGEQLAMAVNYDLIILDLNLPGKDGIDVCRYMRENGCTAAVLLLTARNKVSDRDCARISIVLLLMGVAVVLFLSLTLQQSMKNQPLTKVTTTDNIIVIGIDNGKRIVAMYDSTSGKSIWSSDITAVAGKNTSSFSSDSQKVRYNNSGKNICVMAPSGVYSYDGSGNFIGNVLDFSKHMILASGNTVSDLNVDQRGNIYITTREFGSHEIYRYDIDAGAHEARECKAITLAVPVTDRIITPPGDLKTM